MYMCTLKVMELNLPSETGSACQACRGVKVWEMLPAAVQKVTSKVNFKSLLKQICRFQ